jgi:hypothetical protein
VFLFGESGPGEFAPEVPLVCDTLWIDTDQSICTLTWRGVIALARSTEAPRGFVLSLEPRGAAQSWAALRDVLDAATWTRADEPRKVAEARRAAAQREPAPAAKPTVVIDAPLTDATTCVDERHVVLCDPTTQEPETTVPKDRRSPDATRAELPSEGTDAPTRPDRKRGELVSAPDEAGADEPPRPLFTRGDGDMTLLDDSTSTQEGWTEQTLRRLPAFPGADEVDDAPTREAPRGKPAPSAPGAVIPLELYALIQVQLSAHPGHAAAVLRAHAVDDATWRITERHYATALASEAARGKSDLASKLDAALEHARRVSPT